MGDGGDDCFVRVRVRVSKGLGIVCCLGDVGDGGDDCFVGLELVLNLQDVAREVGDSACGSNEGRGDERVRERGGGGVR